MRVTLLFAGSLLALSSFCQLPQLYWSTPIAVADGADYGNINPDIVFVDGQMKAKVSFDTWRDSLTGESE